MKKLTLVYTNGKPFALKGEDVYVSDGYTRHIVHIVVDDTTKNVGGSVKVVPSKHIQVVRSELLGYAIRDKHGRSEVECFVPSRKGELMQVLLARKAL